MTVAPLEWGETSKRTSTPSAIASSISATALSAVRHVRDPTNARCDTWRRAPLARARSSDSRRAIRLCGSPKLRMRYPGASAEYARRCTARILFFRLTSRATSRSSSARAYIPGSSCRPSETPRAPWSIAVSSR